MGCLAVYPALCTAGNQAALLDAGIPGITLPDALPATPEKAWKTWHFAFHLLPDLPEALISGREEIYLEWFLRRKTASPMAFSDADIARYVRLMQQNGALRAGLALTEKRRLRCSEPDAG